MSVEEKLALIEECMDLDEGSLKLESRLDEYEEWDSLTVLSIIATVAEKTGRNLTGDELKRVRTVSDIVKLIG